MSLSSKKILIMDGGAYSFLAQFMVRYFGKVYYHRITGGVYHESPQCRIGTGLPGVEWVASPYPICKEVDVIFFPDVNDYARALEYKAFGLPVCSSLGGAKMELDKYHFLSMLNKAGLPVPRTYRAEGLTDLWNYLKGKEGPLYMKNAHAERGDWETAKYINPHQGKKLIDAKRQQLGERAETIEILVQNRIDSECEFGIDGFMLNGQLPNKVCGGYEAKDRGMVQTVFDQVPEVVQGIMDKLSPEYARLGYQGPYSNEIRITAGGKAYPIDETCRCASPATATQLLLLGESYAQAVYDLAHGVLPTIKAENRYAAEIVLTSNWHRCNELHVGAVKELEKLNVFPRNSICEDGQVYCVPNGDDEVFGSVAAASNKSIDDAIDKVLEAVEKLDIFQMKYDPSMFDEVHQSIKCGEKHGIHFA